MCIAHKREQTGQTQTVQEHCEATAKLCRDFSIPPLKEVLYTIGLLHDVGKYQPSFQQKIKENAQLKVEHSTCGALAAEKHYSLRALSKLMGYCIAGHHSGLPDAGSANDTPDLPTLSGRMGRTFEDYSAYEKELNLPQIDQMAFLKFLVQDCDEQMDKLVDKFAFLTRYCFSCLTDADSLDTRAFCGGQQSHGLKTDFARCLEQARQTLSSFVPKTELQKARTLLQQQAFEKVGTDSEIYLMNMPTGSGKTLCSIRFALDRAILKGKKRIIYVIPYNSIIDQTAESFEKMFGKEAQLLRHQSTFSYEDREDYDEDYRLTAKIAAENWDAQLIITTAVQFFESLYSNRRGKLRKLHNMADSILIFDEAHLMPQNYLQPCLQAIAYLTRYLNSEAVFLTATMPNFKRLVEEYGLSGGRMTDLIDDRSYFSKFSKCTYQFAGKWSDVRLLSQSQSAPSSLIVVNRRASARRLYHLCGGKKYHLSTYMTAYDRQRVIAEIRAELLALEEDYPGLKNVPENRRVTVISTSLIEAGVDLDFYTVFRELTGLDSILQAGGRCNREGKRLDAEVFVFELEQEGTLIDERASLAKGLIQKYDDISCPECIEEYYNRLFFLKQGDIVKNTMSQNCSNIESIPFRTYAEQFKLIDSSTVSVVAVRDENSRELVERLKYTGEVNARKLQKYTFTVHRHEWEDLKKQNVISDYSSGIWCLTNQKYYDENTGVKFEAEDAYL